MLVRVRRGYDRTAVLDHNFNGTPFTVGIEEELMLIDADSLDLAQEVEAVLAAVPSQLEGQVKRELMQSVLEVATTPCATVADAAEQLRVLRLAVAEICEARGMLVGAAGTHPTARWEDQLIVERERYQQLARELAYIARRELIFGMHVHVGMVGADRAIYVADGIRRYLPLLLALSANSPFWRGHATGMMSTRVPIFRAFPRQGIPPHYGTWEIFSNRVETMVRSGAIADYTYLWWDVRPHPKLGTVETRVCDQQTDLRDTVALAALIATMSFHFSRRYDEGVPLVEYPAELLDDNKIRAALRGMDGRLVDFRAGRNVAASRLAEDVIEALAEDAEELGVTEQLEPLRAIIADGTSAGRQIATFERELDLHAVLEDIAL